MHLLNYLFVTLPAGLLCEAELQAGHIKCGRKQLDVLADGASPVEIDAVILHCCGGGSGRVA
jgi:hypothetical protein